MQRVARPLACCACRAASRAASRSHALQSCHAAAQLTRGRARSRSLQLNALGSSFLTSAPPPPPIAGPRADLLLIDANPLLYAAHFAFEGAHTAERVPV